MDAMSVAVLLLSAGIGGGLWLVVAGLVPPKVPLAEVLRAGLDPAPPRPPAIVAATDQGWVSRAGAPAVGFLAGHGLPRASVRKDLAVLGRPLEQHLAEQAALAVAGLLLPWMFTVLLAATGTPLPIMIPAWAGLGAAVVGFFTPDLGIRGDADARRADVRHALSAFLDLVVIALAGGAGVEEALDDASSVGTGWAFAQIRRALTTARLARVPPWQLLARLGEELDVPELSELAASVSLAGSEGAKVRASLAAKADALRGHQLTDAETEAQAATERMSMPVVLLFAGFLIFIAFPAVTSVLTTI